jgi:hypothetical protein
VLGNTDQDCQRLRAESLAVDISGDPDGVILYGRFEDTPLGGGRERRRRLPKQVAAAGAVLALPLLGRLLARR